MPKTKWDGAEDPTITISLLKLIAKYRDGILKTFIHSLYILVVVHVWGWGWGGVGVERG